MDVFGCQQLRNYGVSGRRHEPHGIVEDEVI
jgi:hypothetical protein